VESWAVSKFSGGNCAAAKPASAFFNVAKPAGVVTLMPKAPAASTNLACKANFAAALAEAERLAAAEADADADADADAEAETDADNRALIAALSAATPPGGLSDIPRVWFSVADVFRSVASEVIAGSAAVNCPKAAAAKVDTAAFIDRLRGVNDCSPPSVNGLTPSVTAIAAIASSLATLEADRVALNLAEAENLAASAAVADAWAIAEAEALAAGAANMAVVNCCIGKTGSGGMLSASIAIGRFFRLSNDAFNFPAQAQDIVRLQEMFRVRFSPPASGRAYIPGPRPDGLRLTGAVSQ